MNLVTRYFKRCEIGSRKQHLKFSLVKSAIDISVSLCCLEKNASRGYKL